MARGWESKSVEEQQAEAMGSRQPPAPRLTADQMSKQREKQGLMLSRSRIVQQLEAATNPIHRRMLEQALADVDQTMARLG